MGVLIEGRCQMTAERGGVMILYSNIENMVLWARSEITSSAIDQICSWFQVSGFRCQDFGYYG